MRRALVVLPTLALLLVAAKPMDKPDHPGKPAALAATFAIDPASVLVHGGSVTFVATSDPLGPNELLRVDLNCFEPGGLDDPDSLMWPDLGWPSYPMPLGFPGYEPWVSGGADCRADLILAEYVNGTDVSRTVLDSLTFVVN